MLCKLSVAAIIKKCHDIQKGEVMTEEEYREDIKEMIDKTHSIKFLKLIFIFIRSLTE